MKRLLLLASTLLLFITSQAQISITASDMPVAGDTLRYSNASPAGSTINLNDTGTNIAWNFALTSLNQGIDSYLTASQVSLLYTFLIGPTAIGYKVADSFPGLGALLPVSIKSLYTFFETKSGPSRYQAQAFAANIAGIPSPFNYTTPDVWYYFPLNYSRQDSGQYSLTINIPSVASLKQAGYRKSRVDGWGTIVTPYYTTPTNCIRVRQEKHEIDSIKFGTLAFGVPANTVEYKWLVNGDHYPALWVTTNVTGTTETISQIRYRDHYRDTSTHVNNATPNVTKGIAVINAYPNPSATGIYTLEIPEGWNKYSVEVFDMQSKLVANFVDTKELKLTTIPGGEYLVRVISGEQVGYVHITK